MKKHISVLIMLLIAGQAIAGAPDSLWSRTSGWPFEDTYNDIRQTSDGGYIIAGYFYPNPPYGFYNDARLVRTDASGNTLWSLDYGYPGYNDDNFNWVCQTPDGGFAVVGYVRAARAGWCNDHSNGLLLRTDANGNILWSREFNAGSHEDVFSGGLRESDGSYALWGYSASDVPGCADGWMLKTNANGDSLWSRTYGGAARDLFQSGAPTSDGGYILAGTTESFGAGGWDFWLVKTDANGNSLWSRTYGGSSDEGCATVIQTSDGGYAMLGYTASFGAGGGDVWLVKANANGDSLWSRTFGGLQYDQGIGMEETADGGLILVGVTCSFGHGGGDMWLIKTDANGNMIWSRTYGGSSWDSGSAVRQTSDGGFILAGTTFSFGGYYDGWLVKTGPELPGSGYVTLVSPGPPDWGYRLHWQEGSVSQLIFTSLCPGTTGSVTGEAAQAGWTATSGNEFVMFTAANPLTSGSLSGFVLSHPYCGGDVVTWIAGDSTGSVDGPLPVELMSFTAIEGDQQVTLRWVTASETNNDYFEIRRDAVLVAQVESEGSSTSGHEYSWTDQGLENGVIYTYTLTAVDMSGGQEEIGRVNATPTDAATVTEYALHQNYPNPFNANTVIRYALPEAGRVTLKVYNTVGQVVATLVDKEQAANTYRVTFDASPLTSGVYVYVIEVNDYRSAHKMALIK